MSTARSSVSTVVCPPVESGLHRRDWWIAKLTSHCDPCESWGESGQESFLVTISALLALLGVGLILASLLAEFERE
jgi:hypothetical protein